MSHALALHADAVHLMETWRPTSDAAAAARDRTLTLLRSGPQALRRDGGPDHLTASALVLDAAHERVLLCLHGRIGRWVQLGGHCEPADATLAAAALREATEESGIDALRLLPEPIDVNVHAVRCSAGPSRHFDVRFVAVAPPDAVPGRSAESTDLRWFPTGALPEPLAEATADLIPPALAAINKAALRSARSRPGP